VSKYPSLYIVIKLFFQFENLFKSIKSGMLVYETSIIFYERAECDSKFYSMDAFIFIESFIKIILGFK